MPDSTRGPAGRWSGFGAMGSDSGILRLRSFRRRGDAYARRAASVHLGYLEPVAVMLDDVADARQPAGHAHDVARDGRVGPLRQLEAGQLRHLVEVDLAFDLDRAADEAVRHGLGRVVLVADVADDLLYQVLERDDAVGTAVL